jgi:hypothetical protein
MPTAGNATVGGWIWIASANAWALIVYIVGDTNWWYVIPGPAPVLVNGTTDLTTLPDNQFASAGTNPENVPSGGG